MAFPRSGSVVREPSPLPPTINSNSPLNASKRLSISAASATALPVSPHSASPSPARNIGQKANLVPSPNGYFPRTPLHRSPSSMSMRARSETPTLLRKASMNSLHGVGGVTPSRSSSSQRSSSAHISNASTMVGRSPLSETEYVEPPPKHTAASIARNHFKAELDQHEKGDESRSSDTIVILHDSVYGHRYSRPRTSKASLSTIVERPERIQASVLGLSVAYVRLGERHAEGQYALHPDIDPASIPSVPFRIRKTTRKLALNSPTVTNVHGVKWMEELKIMCDNAESRLAMNGKELTRPDMNRGSEPDPPPKFHEGDLYLCAESLNAMEGALGAVCEGVDAVFEGSATGNGPHRTFVAIRPPGHHCSSGYPSGFCWLNNVHVGISHASLTHGLTHAAIIDFDLHHGDGSQAIAWEHNTRAHSLAKNALPWKKTSIGYFSLHDINSYPCEMGDEEKVKNASLCIENAHGQTIWNVHLQPWKSEAEFWELYETRYSVLLEKARTYLRAQTERLRSINNGAKAKGAIFISAGFDASEWESSGMQRHKVNVPTEFYARLTRDVVKLAAEEGTAVDGRIISVLEGGYSDRALCTGVLSHISGMTAGDPVVIKKEPSPLGLGYEMGQKIGAFNGMKPKETVSEGILAYDPLWWSVPRLEQLDAVVRPGPPPEAKKAKETITPTYSSPTQSFIAKVTSPQGRRNVVNMSRLNLNGSPRSVSRPPSPPPPDVDWTVAAHELSKLLIPDDRQTGSCRPEDLNAEATRARRDRQSVLTPPLSGSELAVEQPTNRMALRTRKPPKPAEPVEEEIVPPKNRRRTVAGTLTAEKAAARSSTPKLEPSYTRPTNQSSRRLSLVSNADSVISEATVGHGRVPSNGHVQYRPGTSQSIRPESSMSIRGRSIPPVVVKKTRQPSQTAAKPKTSRARKKSPLNDGGNAIPENEVPPSLPMASHDIPLPSIETSHTQQSDMDSLTAGMGKIKISLLTERQKAEREQAKQAAQATTTKTAKTASSKAKPRSTQKAPIDPIPAAAPVHSEPAPMDEVVQDAETKPVNTTPPRRSSLLPDMRKAMDVGSPGRSPALPGRVSSPFLSSPPRPVPYNTFNRSQPPSAPGSDVFVPYQPGGPPQESTVEHAPLQWLPPNTGTPSALNRGDLPVFSSTGVIPFGQPRTNGFPSDPKKENTIEKRKSIWEVPETPRKL